MLLVSQLLGLTSAKMIHSGSSHLPQHHPLGFGELTSMLTERAKAHIHGLVGQTQPSSWEKSHQSGAAKRSALTCIALALGTFHCRLSATQITLITVAIKKINPPRVTQPDHKQGVGSHFEVHEDIGSCCLNDHQGLTAGVSTAIPIARLAKYTSSAVISSLHAAYGCARTPLMQPRKRRASEPMPCHSKR